MHDPMFAGELARLDGCRLQTFTAEHGRDYDMNQRRCVELFCRHG